MLVESTVRMAFGYRVKPDSMTMTAAHPEHILMEVEAL
jgi:hypothetical protein